MNLKQLFRTLLVLLFFVGIANAQTFYVNNFSGNDANSGTSPANAKATVSAALLSAPSGSTISVAYTGIDYTENTPGMDLLPGPLTPGVTGTYTFVSTGGTPNFTQPFQVGTAATAGTITFTGPFEFNGLTLLNGTLAGGNNITITSGALVKRTEQGSITSGALVFAGTANFEYQDAFAGASNITVGLEFPTANNVANNFTLTAASDNLTFTLNRDITILGLLNGDGDGAANTATIALSTYTFNFSNSAGQYHVIDGNVTGTGSLSFNLGANASLDGLNAARSITNLIVGGGAFTFTLNPTGANDISTVGNVTLNGSATLTMQNTGAIGNITHNGSGALTTAQTAPGTVGNVLMSSTATSAATLNLNLAAVGNLTTGTITQSGQGAITFGANVTGTITSGNVLLNSSFNFTTTAVQTNRGLITYPATAANVTINGTLTNQATFAGSTDDPGNNNNGIISFLNTGNVTVTGTTLVNVSGAVTITAPGTVLDNGNIVFDGPIGTALFAAITNQSTIDLGTGKIGSIYTTATTTFAVGFTAGAITNSSSNNGTAGRGDIEFQDVTSNMTISSISQTGFTGGDILLGDGNLTVTQNITSSRGNIGADIIWGTAAGPSTLTVNNIINSGASRIVFSRTQTGAVTINQNVQQTGTGTISFPNATTATIAMVGWTVSNGTFNIAGASATGNVNVTGPVSLTGGTVDLGNGARTVTMNNASIQIGGNNSNVTFLNTGGPTCSTEFLFTQPIPNVNQIITIGGLNQEFPGYITVNNVSAIPAPYVIFQSLYGSSNPGNLIITNTGAATNALTFNSIFGGVLNTIKLDNVRIYIGKNDPGGVAGGGFQNTTGYVTENGGFVMMNGNAAQVVNGTAVPTAGATFGNFGVDNNGGVVTFGNATCVFTADFYLAEGTVNFTNAQFNGTSPNWPTVYRTEGTFTTVPNVAVGTFINVVYYGNDKATANETGAGVPVWNLTVATTNGANPGKGIVTLGGNITVNGTLTINADQSFYTAAKTLTLNGASAVVNGYLVDDGGIRVQLAAATGTVFSGNGYLPSIQVNAGSVGNQISGRGLISNGFGGDGVWGGGNDDFTTMDGNVIYAGGAASSLTATFSAPVAPSTSNFNNLTTAAGATFTLGADAIMMGNMTHAAGAIVLGDYTLDHMGTAPNMTGGATITSTANGKLLFQTGSPTFNVNVSAATIGANVVFSGDTQTMTLPAASQDLTITGNLTLKDKSTAAGGATFNIGAGRTLTAAGANVTVENNCAFVATDGGTTGILRLDVAAPNTVLTWNSPANSSVTNLTIDDNVTLAGGILGSTLTVGQAAAGAFIHNAGELNIGTANLQIGNANATNFNRTGATATYSGSGYLIWNSTGAFNHSTVVAAGAMTINKLRLLQNLALVNPGGINVLQNLDILNSTTFTNSVAGTGYLTVGDANNVPTITLSDNASADPDILTNAPTFGNTDVDYVFAGVAGGDGYTVTTRVWPTAQSARNVTVNTLTTNQVKLAANRTITTSLTLTEGQLVWDSPVTVTLNSGVLITRDQGASMTRDADVAAPVGTLVAPLVDLKYTNIVGNSGEEYSLPTEVRHVTLGLPSGTEVNITSSRTITGTITWNSTLIFMAPTTNITLAQTLPSGSTVTVNGGATVNWNGGITVNGIYNNNGTSTGSFAGTGTLNNNGTLTLTGLNLTGTSTLNLAGGSTTTLTGDANIVNLILGLTTAASISTNSNLTFSNNAWTGSLLNLTFTGTNNQVVNLGANRVVNDVNLTKGNDGTVTFNGGNVTLNGGAKLNLTRGILVVQDPYVFTLNLTVGGGIITDLGYTRNLANTSHFAHVVGKLGVAVPAGTIGRTEWPVGSINPHYRPAAITFTAGNATIAPTTIIVSHVDATPTGVKNFPVDGGFKFAEPTKKLYIAGRAPYYWVFEATTSLGASQKFDVELNGTNLQKPLENHNDLRIIRRFDGDVTVNGWFLEGAANSYSNAMYVNTPNVGDTLLVVRNIGSTGSAISQKAIFTIGLPSLKPVFTATAPANVTINEDDTYNFTFAAIDQDANPVSIVYSLQGTVPANASINATTGVFTFHPDYTQGSTTPYTFTVRAAKSNDPASYVEYTFNVLVNNVNRPPVFAANGQMPNQTVKYGNTVAFTYAATDPDGDALTYNLVSITPAPSVAPTITTAMGVGQFSWTPAFADNNKTFTVVVSVTDGNATVNSTAATITVTPKYERGDANLSGVVDINDAIKILDYTVGKTTLTAEAMLYADCNTATGDAVVGAFDAAYVLKYIANNNSWSGVTKSGAVAGAVEFSKLSSENGVVTLPLVVSNAKGVTSIYAEAEIGQLEIGKVTSRLPEGWIVSTSTENGKVRFAAAGVNPISDGIFATIEVKVKDKETAVSVVGNAKLNDELSSSLQAKVREIPSEFALGQNYPNPFNPTTTIKFSIAQDARVSLVVYDMLGQKVRTLVDGEQEAGYYSVRWDGTNDFGSKVSSGIYIYRLQAGNFVRTMKMNLMK